MRILLLSTIVAGVIGATALLSPVRAAADVHLFFSPLSLTLPPTQTTELVADLGSHGLAFAHVELTFDPALVRVDGEITTTPTLSTVVRKTNPDEANKTGRIVLAVALPPGEQEPPTGTVTLATIPLTSAARGRTTSSLAVDSDQTQLITLQERLLTVDDEKLKIVVQPARRSSWFYRLLKSLRLLR